MNYPRTTAEITQPERKYKPEVLRVLRAFRHEKPWQGDLAVRQDKITRLHRELCNIYGLNVELRFNIPQRERPRGNGLYYPSARVIVLVDKLSVVTYLHEFAHAAFGHSERTACAWSVNLYRRIFPRSAASMTSDGHMVVRNTQEET